MFKYTCMWFYFIFNFIHVTDQESAAIMIEITRVCICESKSSGNCDRPENLENLIVYNKLLTSR